MPMRRHAVASRLVLIDDASSSNMGSAMGMYRAMSECDRSWPSFRWAKPAITRLDASASTNSGGMSGASARASSRVTPR